MKTTIYYFSATGNSLKLARDLGRALGNCDLVSMAKAGDIPRPSSDRISDRIGFVFPVYAWGLPRIVRDFVERLDLVEARYIFAVATCVAIPGKTLRELADLCKAKGARLHAGFAVKAGRSSLMRLNKLDRIIIALNRPRKQLRSSEDRLGEILGALACLKVHAPETSALLANAFGSMLHGLAMRTFKDMDAHFVVRDACKGCGTCVTVCPRGNVRLESGRPSFTHNCELCHACIQWCPQFAIRHPGFEANPRQYHNPAVQVSDMA
jgi:ferredoxin/flavodoxin